MIKHYTITAFRNIIRNRWFSFINLSGLAAAMAICMLIISIVRDQNNYDTFHKKEDRIYRVISSSNHNEYFASCPAPLAEEMKKLPAVEDFSLIRNSFWNDLEYRGRVLSTNGYYTSSSFFKLFDFPLKYGNPSTALADPYSIVLTEETADKMQVNDPSFIGETIRVPELGDFKLTGIVKHSTHKTHLQFEVLCSYASIESLRKQDKLIFSESSWANNDNAYLYLLLKEAGPISTIEEEFEKLSQLHYANAEQQYSFHLQTLSAISPGKSLTNNLSPTLPYPFLVFLILISMAVLITACFNYTNLTVARDLTRAKELGVRKVMGASRRNVFFQLLWESVSLALIALIIAATLFELILVPQFEQFFSYQVLNIQIDTSPKMYLLFLGFAVISGALAGVLPASYLSAFQPVVVLKKFNSLKVFSKLGWRKLLIISQFVIALVFFATALILYQQTEHMLRADYGFDNEHILNLELQDQDFETVSSVLNSHPDILQISGCSFVPGLGSKVTIMGKFPGQEEEQVFDHFIVDHHFIPNLNLDLLAGRNFLQDDPKGMTQVVINALLAKKMGFEKVGEAIGKTMLINSGEGETNANIIGVVNNIIHHHLAFKKTPLVMSYDTEKLGIANLKLNSERISETLAFIDAQWSQLDPHHPASYRFFDEALQENLGPFMDLKKLIGFLTLITILITALGLMGISSYIVETRKKEIGIRKVLGAGLHRIVWMLSKGMIYPIGIALIIAVPAVWWLNNLWLQNIAYRISLHLGNMGIGIMLLVLAALFIVASQSFRIANKNPVEVLRTE